MARGPVYRGRIRATVDTLARDRSRTAETVLEELQQLFPEACKELHIRTVARWLQAARGEPGTPWTSIGADAGDAAIVFEILDSLMEGDPSASVTTAEAGAIMLIRRTVPLMPAASVYAFAQDYVAAGDDVQHLDLSLIIARRVRRAQGGFQLDPDSIAQHVQRHVKEWIGRPLRFWSGSEAGGATYVRELGRHAAAVTRGGRWHYLEEEGDGDFTWYSADGAGCLYIDSGKGPLA